MRALALFAFLATIASAFRYAMYMDADHSSKLPSKELTAGITHVIVAFAKSSLFLADSTDTFKPFMPIGDIRAMFDPNTKVCLAIGGWGDTAGFSAGSATDDTRNVFANKIAQILELFNFDCVDIDWEYPGGNGDDYKVPGHLNSDKTAEIGNFRLLLSEIRSTIDGSKALSIAVPGLVHDMIAYSDVAVRELNTFVDFVNVMSYDLMNRRSNHTTHQSSLMGALKSIDTYIARGFSPSKLNLGYPFYAKYFTLADAAAAQACYDHGPLDCPTAVLEDPVSGNDTGLSGAVTFESSSYTKVPSDLTLTTNGKCGGDTTFKCAESACCSQSGFCGVMSDFCGTGCQNGYGKKCDGFSVQDSFLNAVGDARYDSWMGGHWSVDVPNKVFWTFDTKEDIVTKFNQIVNERKLGGVFAWSLGEDSHNWERLAMLRDCVSGLKPEAQTQSSGKRSVEGVTGSVQLVRTMRGVRGVAVKN